MDVHLKNLFGRFQEQFGSGPGLGPGSGTCLMKVNGIAPPFVKSLYRAAAALYRTDPWRRLRPGHIFGIRVGKDSDWSRKKQLFRCIQFIGGDGGDVGLYLFKSEKDAVKMTGVMETIRVPNIEVFRVTFEVESLMSSSNKKMVSSMSLEVAGRDRYPVFDVARCSTTGELQFRIPTLEELTFVYAAIKAVSLLHPLLQQDVNSGPKWSKSIYFEPFIETVDVQWPLEMAKGNDLVAVTISLPLGQGYDDKNNSSANSTPTKYSEPLKEETLGEVKINSSSSLRRCIMCENDVYEVKSISCGHCRAVVYCGSACQQQHWQISHRDSCGLYKAMMEREKELRMNIFSFTCSAENPCKWLEAIGVHEKGMWRRKCICYSHYPFGLLPHNAVLQDSWGGLDNHEYPHDSPFRSHLIDPTSGPILLSGWFEYYNLRSLPFSSPVSDILSHPLTVHYILTTLNINSKNLLMKGKEVILHYIGPEGELDWMPAFSEIGQLLNGVGNIQIIMVGPEVPSNISGTTAEISSRVRVSFVKGFYQEEATYLPNPHAIVALNCGLENQPSWGGALELIKSKEIPAFFTEQSEISCSNAKQTLRSVGLHISYPVTANPFRSPVRSYGSSTNLPSYSNGFVLGVNT